MKPLSYSTFYLLKNRQLTELENGLSTPWTNYLESSAFVLAEFNQGLIVPLSISALLEQTTPSSEASTCEEALNEYLNNSSYESIEASYIPMPIVKAITVERIAWFTKNFLSVCSARGFTRNTKRRFSRTKYISS